MDESLRRDMARVHRELLRRLGAWGASPPQYLEWVEAKLAGWLTRFPAAPGPDPLPVVRAEDLVGRQRVTLGPAAWDSYDLGEA
jgi:hypothetical protein